MQYRIFDDKNIIDGKIDLLSNIWQVDYEKVKIIDWIRIDEQTNMSLDIIAFTMYGDESRMDVLKKFNRIDNPLDLYTGQIIAIPDLTSFNQNLKKVSIKPIQLQRQKGLARQFDNKKSSNIPSKKENSGKSQIRKSKDGVLIF
jgi:hypothetical protein